MRVDVTGRHMVLTAEQTGHAETEAEKLGKFFDGVNEIKITFEREHDQFKAEVICQVSGGKTLVAVEKGRTLAESLELASDSMAGQIKKYKEKLHDHRTHGMPHEEPAEDSEGEEQ